MCLDTVSPRQREADLTLRYGYKWLVKCQIGRRRFFTAPIFSDCPLFLNRWYLSNSENLTEYTTANVVYEPAFHIYTRKKEALLSAFNTTSASRVLVKVAARGIVAEGSQDRLPVFCAREMKIVKVYNGNR